MKLYVDLANFQLIEGPGFRNPITELRFKRGDAARLDVVFLDNGITPTTIGDPESLEIHFGAKLMGQYGADYIVHTDDWTMPASGAAYPVYSCSPSFNNVELDAALFVGVADLAQIILMGEISFREAGGPPTSTGTVTIIVANDVNRGTEGTPLALPTPEAWLAERAMHRFGVPMVSVGSNVLRMDIYAWADLGTHPARDMMLPAWISGSVGLYASAGRWVYYNGGQYLGFANGSASELPTVSPIASSLLWDNDTQEWTTRPDPFTSWPTINFYGPARVAAYDENVHLEGNETVAGEKSFSGQMELTGQLPTNPTSAVNRGMLDLNVVYCKQAADQIVNNSTTPVDSSLSVILGVGVWEITGAILTTSTTTAPGVKFKAVFTGNLAADDHDRINFAQGTSGATDGNVQMVAVGSEYQSLASSSAFFTAILSSVVRVIAAGDFKIQFAQKTATAENTQLSTVSMLLARRISY